MPSIEALGNDRIFELALQWHAQGRGVATATVIATWGSSPRRCGSRLVVDADGNFGGSVSGGCIEGAVITEARQVIETGCHKVLEFGVSDEDAWGFGLTCGGRISVLVEPCDAARLDIVKRIDASLGSREALALTVALAAGSSTYTALRDAPGHLQSAAADCLRLDAAGIREIGNASYYIEPFNPVLRLVIVGASHIAQSLAAQAGLLGFEPHVVDPRQAWIAAERFPGISIHQAWPDEALARLGLDRRTAVVTLSHDPKIDDPALLLAIASDACFIGALGSIRTHAARRRRLQDEGAGSADLERIHAPVGLDIGAATAAEIALSTLAQIVGSLRKPRR